MTDLLAVVCAGPIWEDNNVTLGFFPQSNVSLLALWAGGKRGKEERQKTN